MELSDGVSLLIGKNGAGKTSLIKAIVYAMHFLFTNDKSMGDDYLSAGNPDLKMRSMEYDEYYRQSSDAEVSAYANLHGKLLFEGENIEWDMYRRSTPGSAVNPAKYQNAYRKFISLYKQHNHLPVLAYFSDSFPHKESNVSTFAKQQINSFDKVLRNFGYFQWAADNACTTIWRQRLANAILKSRQLDDTNDFSYKEMMYVTGMLRKFSCPTTENSDPDYEIKNVFVALDADNRPELWLRLASGVDITFSNLPAGYLRLYSIVMDIAYRAFLLNRDPGIEPGGLVVIDEIDLHLHPSLALEVVERLTAVFPEMQFVMSTHSPLVMSGLPEDGGHNKIFHIVKGQPHPLSGQEVYGIDYNTIISDYWGIRQKNDEVDFLLENIRILAKMGRSDLMEIRKKELLRLVGQDRCEKLLQQL